MRSGNTKTAIKDSLNYLASVKSTDPAFKPRSTTERFFSDEEMIRGSIGFIVYLFMLWFIRPITYFFVMKKARNLEKNSIDYKIAEDKNLNSNFIDATGRFIGRLFLSAMPGGFIFVLSQIHLYLMFTAIGCCFIFAALYYRMKTEMYSSLLAYQRALEKRKATNSRSGSSYRSSSSSSSSSSRSSSTRSSSSGGGRSGGGGSSSRW
jgi:uncharacterized membrane protein YgcG